MLALAVFGLVAFQPPSHVSCFVVFMDQSKITAAV